MPVCKCVCVCLFVPRRALGPKTWKKREKERKRERDTEILDKERERERERERETLIDLENKVSVKLQRRI